MNDDLTLREAAAILGVTPTRVGQLVDAGRLPAGRDSQGNRRLDRKGVLHFAAQRQVKQAIEGAITGLMMQAADALVMALPEDEKVSVLQAATKAQDADGRQEPFEVYARREALARLSPNPIDREEELAGWFLEYLGERRARDYPCLQVPLPPEWVLPIRMLIEFVRTGHDALKAGNVAEASRTLWGARVWSWPLGTYFDEQDTKP